MEKVSVNKGLLIGVVAVAAASLLAIAFLLGRSSVSGSSSGPPAAPGIPGGVTSPVSAPRAQDQPPPAPAPVSASIANAADAHQGPTSLTREYRPPSQETPRPAPAPAAVVPVQTGSDPSRAAVAAYLDAVDHIQPGKASGDAEGAANEMAMALAKGDSSELDRMVLETGVAKERLAALTPPVSCSAHYRESLGSLDDALEMLRSLKAAAESPDPASQLASVVTRATALRSRAEALQKEETALRQRYGLTR